jgi:hypothetical protein
MRRFVPEMAANVVISPMPIAAIPNTTRPLVELPCAWLVAKGSVSVVLNCRGPGPNPTQPNTEVNAASSAIMRTNCAI